MSTVLSDAESEGQLQSRCMDDVTALQLLPLSLCRRGSGSPRVRALRLMKASLHTSGRAYDTCTQHHSSRSTRSGHMTTGGTQHWQLAMPLDTTAGHRHSLQATLRGGRMVAAWWPHGGELKFGVLGASDVCATQLLRALHECHTKCHTAGWAVWRTVGHPEAGMPPARRRLAA